MESIVLLCTDGSDVSIEALRSSLPVLAPADRTIVVVVELPADTKLITGTGFSGRSGEDLSAQIETSGDVAAKHILDTTVEALGLDDVELMAHVVLDGHTSTTSPRTANRPGSSARDVAR